MSDSPPPPSFGADPNQPPPTTPYPQSPYQQSGQQSGQQPGQVPYGAPQYPLGGYPAAPDHPQSSTVLVLGILGVTVCGVLAPIAWVMGNRVVAEIDASSGAIGGRPNANAGRICGIIGTALLGVAFLLILFAILGVLAGVATS